MPRRNGKIRVPVESAAIDYHGYNLNTERAIRKSGSNQMRTKHILVADDNPIIRESLCRMVCADDGFDPCSEAENGLEAVKFAQNEHPDLIVMDLSMPVLDGLEAAKRIREVIPRIAIVLVSMHAALLSDSDMRRFGISALVAKDRAAKDLLPALCSLLNLARPGTT